ncbi:MAG: hypothetical protein ABIF10_01975 [Candidatus Woesearchaeota archaeon]
MQQKVFIGKCLTPVKEVVVVVTDNKIQKKEIIIFVVIVAAGILLYFLLFGVSKTPVVQSTQQPNVQAVASTPPLDDILVNTYDYNFIPNLAKQDKLPSLFFKDIFSSFGIGYQPVRLDAESPAVPDSADVERLSVSATNKDLFLRLDLYGPVDTNTYLYQFEVPKAEKVGETTYQIQISGQKEAPKLDIKKLTSDKRSSDVDFNDKSYNGTFKVIQAGNSIEVQVSYSFFGLTLKDVPLLPFGGFNVEVFGGLGKEALDDFQ